MHPFIRFGFKPVGTMWEHVMNLKKLYRTAAFAVAGGIMVAAVSAAPAAAAMTFDFTKLNTDQSGPAGNVRVYTADDGVTKVAVSAYTAVSDGHNGFTLYDSYLGSYINGLGVTGTYPGIGDTSHTVDSQRGIDFLVFQFSRDVTVDLAKFTVLSVGGVGDSDATIGFGDTDTPYLTSLGLDSWNDVTTLFTPFADNLGNQSNAVRDINPGDASGNLLFIGAGLFSELNKIDNFKIATLTAAPAVPEPASWALMIGGFALAGAAMRRRARVVFA